MQEIEFLKQGSLSLEELDAVVSVLQLAGGKLGQNKTMERKQQPPEEKSIASLESMGVRVYGFDESHVNSVSNDISWDNIAGYHQQKRYVLQSGPLHVEALFSFSWFFLETELPCITWFPSLQFPLQQTYSICSYSIPSMFCQYAC